MGNRKTRKIIYYFISFLLIALAIEVGLQVINGLATLVREEKEDNPLLLYCRDKKMAAQIWKETWEAIKDRDYAQFLGWADRTYHGRYVNEDQQSGRKTWNPEALPARTLEKVFFLGGSSGWGLGVRDDYTIPSYLSRMLNHSGSRFQVLNYSVPGYIFMQGIVHLTLMLKEGRSPQYVIFYDGFNEIYAANQHGIAGTVHNLEMTREKLRRENMRYREVIWKGFKEAVRKYCMTYKALNSLHLTVRKDDRFQEIAQSYNDDQLRSLSRDIAEDYKKSIKLLDYLSRAYGFKYICFWQPNLLTETKLLGKESQVDPRLENKVLKKLCLYTNEYLQKEKIPHFYILADVLKERPEPVYLDVAHVTEKGNEMVAKVIYQYMQKDLFSMNVGNYAPKSSH